MRAFWIATLSLLTLSGATYLSGCAAPIAAIGASSTAAASSAGTSVAAAAVANPVTATSVASTITTGKSPLEHAASAATKKECKDRKSTRLNSSHTDISRMPSSA